MVANGGRNSGEKIILPYTYLPLNFTP